jgi:aryl-alcohol dehydrogenase-like predicted oxidoreductase
MRLSQNGRTLDAASGPRDRGSAIRTLRTAVELGVNHIDTAAFYFSSLRAQVRLAWALHQGPHVLTIPGTGSPDHLAENVAAAALCLSDDEVARLDRLG